MPKIDQELLDELAQLEVDALKEGLQDEELRRNPAFLEKVRKFLAQNKLNTTSETPGVQDVRDGAARVPVFDN